MQLLSNSPKFNLPEIIAIVRERYGLETTAQALPSERDQNFLLTATDGTRYVFKIANALEDYVLLDAQHRAMEHLAQHTALCARTVAASNGAPIVPLDTPDDKKHFARLVTYLDGVPMGAVKFHSDALLFDLGRRLGELDRALESFDHPALHRDFHWDLANGLRVLEQYAPLIADAETRAWVEHLAKDFSERVAPLLPKLRRSIIYNDANDYNILVGGGANFENRNQEVVGLIDLGDMVHSYTVCDLAIAMAYAILEKRDPLHRAAEIVRGYHGAYPLRENEIAALFGLMQMRLAMSACHAAWQQAQRPDDPYLSISQTPIRNTIPALEKIPPRFAEAIFRAACELSPVPACHAVTRWLQDNSESFAPVLETDLRGAPVVVFDLSVTSPLLHGDARENAEPFLTARLWNEMRRAGAQIGIGRYDQARLLYTGEAFATGAAFDDETRTIHLGVDLFTEAGTRVCAPIAGTVHAFSNNAAPQDYGPVILLKHRTDDGTEFFTLYGHLSVESLDNLYVGKSIVRGEPIGTIGAAESNGEWSPHLHFQIISDLLGRDCDFPGVGRASERAVWHALSPDPNLILQIPRENFPPDAPTKNETLAARRKWTGGNLSIAYRAPLKIERGWMQYLFDENAQKYLDAYNNVPHVGHAHPRVVQAAHAQLQILNTNTRYLHDLLNEFAEKLTALLPAPLGVCYFVNSGSEANELAVRLARTYTRQRDMIVLDAAYHGNTNTLIDLSPYKHNGPGGAGTPAWVHIAPIPDDYRGAYKRGDARAGESYARHVAEIVEKLQARGKGLVGFIAESAPSVGGQIILPQGYLDAVYRSVRAAGGVCIADEVQTGYGRLGTHFWAFEPQKVVPDIVVLGKPIGNGYPLGAVITTRETADAFDNGMEFFSTFGGSTVSCAVGLTVLDVVLQENLQHHARRVGEKLLQGLRPFVERYQIVGDVRGSGLFLGVELVRDRETLEPAAAEASFVVNRLRARKILAGTDGPFHNVVKIRPPMPFDENDAEFLVEALEGILAERFAD